MRLEESIPMQTRHVLALAALCAVPAMLPAQGGSRGGPRADSTREAQRLDQAGEFAQSRAIFQRLIDTAPDPAARAAAQRRMAMSYGFEGNCAKAVEYEEMVIAYWVTREAAEPQNAFYQEGEMANEAARVCIDAGDIDTAERMYRRGSDLGNREPEPRTHPRSLWDYRLAHAEARIAARRGDAAEAKRQVALARAALDSDSAMAEGQEAYFPYLVGYVALYTGDLATAEAELTKSVDALGRDPFQKCLLGMTYEKLGQADKAMELYRAAYEQATAHNPPAAFARRFTREKLQGAGS
jgi:tetratricopeptide (TPR) repeat protein